jgi:hypothetical protein
MNLSLLQLYNAIRLTERAFLSTFEDNLLMAQDIWNYRKLKRVFHILVYDEIEIRLFIHAL